MKLVEIHNFKKLMKYSMKNRYKNIGKKKDKKLVSVYHLKYELLYKIKNYNI